jgi:predicted Zn-dependent protease
VHPVIRFEFTVPPGFILNNGSTAVTARSRAGAAIVFDSAAADAGGAMPEYVRDRWGRELALTELSRFTVSGMEAATAAARVTTRKGATDLRLVAIRGADRRIYRFLFATPVAETARLADDLQRTTFSFRMLSAAEAAAEKPYRIRIHEARSGDTVAKLSARMPEGPQPEDRFRVLNGIAAGQEPLAGQLLKYVAF